MTEGIEIDSRVPEYIFEGAYVVMLDGENTLIRVIGSINPNTKTFWGQRVNVRNPSATTAILETGTVDTEIDTDPFTIQFSEVRAAAGQNE